jgi:hypothetical protein
MLRFPEGDMRLALQAWPRGRDGCITFPTKQCEICGEEFKRRGDEEASAYRRRKTCGRDCWLESVRRTKAGANPPQQAHNYAQANRPAAYRASSKRKTIGEILARIAEKRKDK